jgi:adenosine kinase
MTSNPAPIVVSGSIAIDRIMNFSGRYADYLHPEKLNSLSISLFLKGLNDSHGGVGANIAYSLALLGEEPVLLGAVGEDGRLYLEKLAKHGVNITHVYESERPTASFNVMTDSDENQIGGFYPGAMFDSHTLSFKPWREKNPIAVVSPHDPDAMRRQVAECREWGLSLCYDVGQQVSNLDAADIAAGVDAAEILILNDYEMHALAAKIGRRPEAIKAAVPVVVTTLGKDGSVVEGATLPQPIRVGIVRPKCVADPTGAGDAFRSGFLYGRSRGWSLRDCARLGATVAAYAVEHQGTQNHHFTPAQAARRYHAAFGEPLPQALTTI